MAATILPLTSLASIFPWVTGTSSCSTTPDIRTSAAFDTGEEELFSHALSVITDARTKLSRLSWGLRLRSIYGMFDHPKRKWCYVTTLDRSAPRISLWCVGNRLLVNAIMKQQAIRQDRLPCFTSRGSTPKATTLSQPTQSPHSGRRKITAAPTEKSPLFDQEFPHDAHVFVFQVVAMDHEQAFVFLERLDDFHPLAGHDQHSIFPTTVDEALAHGGIVIGFFGADGAAEIWKGSSWSVWDGPWTSSCPCRPPFHPPIPPIMPPPPMPPMAWPPSCFWPPSP